jgi:hypothetical protein
LDNRTGLKPRKKDGSLSFPFARLYLLMSRYCRDNSKIRYYELQKERGEIMYKPNYTITDQLLGTMTEIERCHTTVDASIVFFLGKPEGIRRDSS